MANDTDSNGITGGNFDVYGADRLIPRALTAFTAIAWYNSVEILILIFFIFKRYSGLYFWSLIFNALSIIPYATGAWMKQNSVAHNSHVYNALLTIGWVIMVPGQSMILYSRLHLVSTNFKLLRFILWTIIITAIVLCVPTSILCLRQYTKHPEAYTRGYAIMEKIQMTLFAVQEMFIACVYLWEIRKILHVILDGRTRKWMWQLVAMNIFLLFLDTALLVTEYLDLYMIQTTFKSLVYSSKLKLEFAVLSQIVRVILKRNRPESSVSPLPADPKRHGEAVKMVATVVSEADVMQSNIPPNWRLSVDNTAIVSPVTLSIERRGLHSESSSISTFDTLYPGRLDHGR